MSDQKSIPPELMAQIKAIFYQECEEQLSDLEAGLLALKAGDRDPEHINTIFRAAHSIKGGAAAFGFSSLVRFAHSLESVLAEIRSGQLGPRDDVLAVMLRAADSLADHFHAVRDGTDIDAGAATAAMAELARFIPNRNSDVPADIAPPLDIETDSNSETLEQDWTIRFRPHAGLYAKANDPLLLLRELARLGTMQVSLDDSNLPALADLDAEESYLCWNIALRTTESESVIREVFEFVEGECDLELVRGTVLQPNKTPGVGQSVPGSAEMPAKASTGAAHVLPVPSAPFGETIRVDLDRVDRLINLASELVVHEAMLAQRLSTAGILDSSGMELPLDELHHLTRELQDSVMAIRAQPVKSVFQRMSRLVRELEGVTGKQVDLVFEGEATEVDRSVIEHLTDPLTHMVRNAIDHGIETPAERQAAGKSPRGTVKIAASHRAGRILIEIGDDGRGIDHERVRTIAVEKGLISSTDLLSEYDVQNLIFVPGFSTATVVSELSGRGVGMDVVKRGIQTLGGRISVDSKIGQGSTFTLSLPLTLAVLDGMLFSVADQEMVVPLTALLETILPRPGDINRLGSGTMILNVRGEQVPLIDLGEHLGFRSKPLAPRGVVLFVEDDHGRRAALLVDDVSGQRQVVIKSVQTNYCAVDGIAAATILGDGRVSLILDVNAVLLSSGRRRVAATPEHALAS